MDDTLAQQIDEFDRCVRERDRGAAEVVLDAGFALVLVHPEPAVMPRQRWLEVLADYVVDAFEVQERTVDEDGDCAVVLQRVQMEATVLGEDRSGVFVISDIWRLRPEGWRIWRRHSTPLSAGRLPGA
jgi:ketosteroid isomerase-like protein